MVKAILAVDIGGTSIKFAKWTNNQLTQLCSERTPDSLAAFYQLLVQKKDQLAAQTQVIGVAISSPGAVNKESGVIEGMSAVPYLHGFPIEPELKKRLALPVSIENDANCAGLAESLMGAGRDADTMISLVIGSGVGGAVIIDHHIWHGAHLFGGEFGYMVMDPAIGATLSNLASPVNQARLFSQESGRNVSGKEMFELAKKGDSLAQKYVDRIVTALAQAAYNLQNSLDVDKIVLGGAVSANPHLLPLIDVKIDMLQRKVDAPGLHPSIVVGKYRNQANQMGAVLDFCQSRSLAINEIK